MATTCSGDFSTKGPIRTPASARSPRRRCTWPRLLWFGFDLLGVTLGLSGIAYWAHLGGFAAGAGIMLALTAGRVIVPTRHEQTLIDVLAGCLRRTA